MASCRMARARSVAILCLLVPEWLEPFCHGQLQNGSGKVSCNTLLISARMARAILARPVAEWLEQFWHGQLLYLNIMQNGSSHSGRAILALKTGRARMARTNYIHS